MKKKTFLTIGLTIVGIAVVVIGGYFAFKGFRAKSDGTIIVKVIDFNDVLIKEKTISYTKSEKLPYLVTQNFNNVKIESGMVMSIETIVTPDDWSSFIAIYINNKMSDFGINDLSFSSGDIISFVNTVLIYNER